MDGKKGIKGIVDRFEGEFAVVEGEDRVMISLPRSALPQEAKEGDSVVEIDGKFQIDAADTARRRERIEKLSQELWE